MIVLRPTPAFAYSHPAHIIAFGFGAGLARFAPGTFGTLAAWLPGWLLAGAQPAILLALVAALFLLGVWACGVTGRHLGVHDHGSMVWDEIVAFLLVAALLPRGVEWQVAGFVLFRGFDIGKPPPIRWIERRWQGGFGVMFDDLVAAGYTLLVLALVKRFFF
jgi:phosphatidylglycerophosphatase A